MGRRHYTHIYIYTSDAQGELLRMIDFRSARIDADSSLDTIKIFVGLGALSLAAAASVVVRGSRCVLACSGAAMRDGHA